MITKCCNEQKFNAKNAGEESTYLFFKRYIAAKGTLKLRAVITDIFRFMMQVVTVATGHTISIIYRMQDVKINSTSAPKSVSISYEGCSAPLELQVLSTVDIELKILNSEICGFFSLPNLPKIDYGTSQRKQRDRSYKMQHYNR